MLANNPQIKLYLLFLVPMLYSCVKMGAHKDDTYEIINIHLRSENQEVYVFKEIVCCGFLSSDSITIGPLQKIENVKCTTIEFNQLLDAIGDANDSKVLSRVPTNFNKLDKSLAKPHSNAYYMSLNKVLKNSKLRRVAPIDKISEYPSVHLFIYFDNSYTYSVLFATYYKADGTFTEKSIIFSKIKGDWELLDTFLYP
ncbi:MAG: hypothetical protein CMC08_03005 [Flavobacteriaceae bacterium]|nr:hypothetical protein [Flavobacteriaceae bacterium]